MLLRRDGDGVLAIGQASHAWVSGQLARAWGNDRFGAVEPWEEVCLAAEQHDVGMAVWDLAPETNPATGLPYAFTEMPLATHLRLWTDGPQRLISQSRYAALLVSMHGYRLNERRDLTGLSSAEAELVTRFLAAQRELHAHLTASLDAPAEQVRRNSDLLVAWDHLSLALCLEWAPCTVPDVPTAGEPTDLGLTPGSGGSITVDPWPFGDDRAQLRFRCEGRRLGRAEETWETVGVRLTPAARRASWSASRQGDPPGRDKETH